MVGARNILPTIRSTLHRAQDLYARFSGLEDEIAGQLSNMTI